LACNFSSLKPCVFQPFAGESCTPRFFSIWRASPGEERAEDRRLAPMVTTEHTKDTKWRRKTITKSTKRISEFSEGLEPIVRNSVTDLSEMERGIGPLCEAPRFGALGGIGGLKRCKNKGSKRVDHCAVVGRAVVCVCVGVKCTYKKSEVNISSTGTPKISFDFCRGILPVLAPRFPSSRFLTAPCSNPLAR
jgi:hypothetical protein